MEARNDAARIARDVEFTVSVLTETGQVISRAVQQEGAHPLSLAVLRERPNPPADEVTEDIVSGERRNVGPVIDIAADHRLIELRMVVCEDWQLQAGHVATGHGRKTLIAFHNVPAEVVTPVDDVHFLETVLAHIAGKEPAVALVEGEAKGISQAVRPDFGSDIGLADERIVGGDGIGAVAVHVEATVLAEIRMEGEPEKSFFADGDDQA